MIEFTLALPRLGISRDRAGLTGITRIEMAAEFGVTPRTIAAWERGEANITAVNLGKWAAIVGQDPNYFYGEGPR